MESLNQPDTQASVSRDLLSSTKTPIRPASLPENENAAHSRLTLENRLLIQHLEAVLREVGIRDGMQAISQQFCAGCVHSKPAGKRDCVKARQLLQKIREGADLG